MNARNKIIAITLLASAVLTIALGIRQASGSVRLNRYLAELRAKGDELTFTEIAIPPSTNSEHVLSRQLFLSNAYAPAGKTFAAPAISLKLMEFVAPGVARVSWRDQPHLDTSPAGSPVTNSPVVGSWAELDRVNELAAAELEKFRRALENPAPDTGWVYQDTFQNVTNAPVRFHFRHRAVAAALVDAEIGALHHGDLNQAIRNLRALIGLAQLDRNEPILVIQGGRIFFAEIGLRSTWEVLQAPGWDEGRLASLQSDWEHVDLFQALERGLVGERASTQVVMQRVRNARQGKLWDVLPDGNVAPRGGFATNKFYVRWWRDQIIPMAYKISAIDDDELLRWTHLTEQLEVARALKSNRPWSEVRLVETNVWKEMDAAFAQKRLVPLLASAYFIPSTRGILKSALETETFRRLAVTAIALKRYEVCHGQPPQKLASLIPEFLAAVPIDPMSGKPLCFRTAPGSFGLYSVGEDGKADGGQGGAALWNGPDALWPTAATPEDEPFKSVAGSTR